jgi:hypothetical protein
MRNLLYYPYINIPDSAWASRVLLYYDHVGAIVPQEYFNNPSQYDDYMLRLVQDELVIPIDPLKTLKRPDKIMEPFLDYINSKEFRIKIRRKAFVEGRTGYVHKDKFKMDGPRIHTEKFDIRIFRELVREGLAKQEDHSWFLVEKKTADELMTFLATVLGAKLGYIPSTNKFKRRYSAVKKRKKYEVIKTIDKKRKLILEELIPFPEQIDARKLRSFKDKHEGILEAFRTRVELIALDPKVEVDTAFFSEKINELKQRKSELSAKMNESNVGKVFFGTFCSLVSGAFSVAGAKATGDVIGAAAGFSNAIYSALQIERAEDLFDQTGMKYLALVDKKLRK